MKTSVLLAGVSLAVAGCHLDTNVGSTSLDEPVDAAFDAYGPAVIPPFVRSDASSIVFDGDAMFFDGDPGPNHGLQRRSPDGTVEVVVPGLRGPFARDADAYYVAAGRVGGLPASRVVAVDRTTYAVTDLTADGLPGVAIALDADAVYVSGGHRVTRVAKDGSRADVILDGIDAAWGLAVDDAFVYVADNQRGQLLAVRKSDAGSFAIVDGGLPRPFGLLVVGDWLYFTGAGDHVDDGVIGRVRRPRAGDPPGPAAAEILLTGVGEPLWMATADDTLYWTAYFMGLQRMPLDGGTVETLVGCQGNAAPPAPTDGPQGCGALAIHGDHAYFAGREPHGAAIFQVAR